MLCQYCNSGRHRLHELPCDCDCADEPVKCDLGQTDDAKMREELHRGKAERSDSVRLVFLHESYVKNARVIAKSEDYQEAMRLCRNLAAEVIETI